MSQSIIKSQVGVLYTDRTSLRPLVGLAIFIFGMQASTTVVFTYPVDCCKCPNHKLSFQVTPSSVQCPKPMSLTTRTQTSPKAPTP